MGQAASSHEVHWGTVIDLRHKTGYSKEQINRMKCKFDELTPPGSRFMTREQFHKGLEDLGVHGKEFLDSLFDIFDKDKTGKINFVDFCTGIALFTRGNMNELAQAMFQLYDTNGTDVITKEEMTDALEAMARALACKGLNYDFAMTEKVALEDRSTVRTFVDEIFAEFDVSRTNSLNFDEFHSALLKHPVFQDITKFTMAGLQKDFFKR